MLISFLQDLANTNWLHTAILPRNPLHSYNFANVKWVVLMALHLYTGSPLVSLCSKCPIVLPKASVGIYGRSPNVPLPRLVYTCLVALVSLLAVKHCSLKVASQET